MSLNISSTCLGSDLTLETRIVTVSPEIIFIFIEENKSFCFRHSYCSNAFLFTFIADVLNSPIQ